MEEKKYSEVVNTARDYYNSDDADNFYATIWGGEDIHIGLYQAENEPIFDASRRTVATMASHIVNTGADIRILDIGSGYGGAARYLSKKFSCQVTALNLSEKENERNRKLNTDQGLEHFIEVVEASFEKIPYPDNTFDIVWSQDAILHSGNRDQVVSEVARVLKPGGEFIFTDIMQAEVVPEGVLQPVYDRIHLSSLGSLDFYRQCAEKNGLKEIAFYDHGHQLPMHYQRVLDETKKRHAEISPVVSEAYLDHMKVGLKNWVDAGQKGYLVWGILHFQKQST